MTKSRAFLFFLLAFIGGIFVRSFFEMSFFLLFSLLVISLSVSFAFYKNKIILLLCFFITCFLFGVWRTNYFIEEANENNFDGTNFHGKALVIKSSETKFGQNLIIELEKEKIVLLLKVPQYPKYNYGDLLVVSCSAKEIENKNNDFDYKMYLAKDKVYYSCENAVYDKLSERKGNFILSYIFTLRNRFEENIIKAMPYPEEILASGILFGGSSGLPESVKDEFSKTGMTHIVAVSGYNVTIIAEYLILLGIFIGFWRQQAIWFAIVGIIMFVTMIGLPSSAVRAAVMSGILLWAMKHGRLASSENAIILAAAIMLFINPLLLKYDIGFQLSFLATLGIVLTSPFWEKSFIKKYKAFGISEIIALSLSAQIFVLPIIVYNFGSMSLISLLANLLVLPIVPVSMLLVFLSSLAGFAFEPLSLVLAWLSYIPIHYELSIIHYLAGFKWASIEIEKFNGWWVFGYYILLILAIFLFKKINSDRMDESLVSSHQK